MLARRRFLFVVALLAFAPSLPRFAQAQTGAPPDKPERLAPDLAFGRSIALIRGHLLTGEELVRARRWQDAYPHFTYPTEEIYGVIREELRGYRTPQFDGALKTLARAVRYRSAARYDKALAKVEAALAAADAGLKARQPDWPQFTVAVAVEVLKVAEDEYDDAIADGRVAHATGYRTARGFVLEADRMIEAVAPQLPSGDAAALAEIRLQVSKIKAAFPQAAPDRPLMGEDAVEDAVSKIERAFRSFAAARQI